MMKAIIQRVTNAKVMVGDELISSIGRGLCILVGLCQTDTVKDVDYMVKKILNLRLFEDERGKRWARNVQEENCDVLCISQFTLYHSLKKNKPDFHQAMQGTEANTLYSIFLQKLGENYSLDKVKDGKFGAYMQVHITNDGPVTVTLDSPPYQPSQENQTNTESKTNKQCAC